MKNVPRLWSLVLCGMLFLLTGMPAYALPVNGLYSYEIQVSNQSSSERNRALGEAMAAVIVKVTGNARWLQNSAVQQALRNAEGFVEETRYRNEAVAVTTTTSAPPANPSQVTMPLPGSNQVSFINVIFARELIDRLLTNAAIPVWDSNRPSLMIWMVLQNDSGERSMLSRDSNPEIIALMQQFALERGIPLLFPVLDFEDRQNLTLDSLWSLDTEAIRRASLRYGADSVMAGRLHITNTGELVGLWQFIFRDQEQVFDSFDSDLRNYVREPLDRVTTQLASHFAIVKSTTGQQKVKLRVEGIGNLAAYSSLVGLLQGLGLVDGVLTSTLDGENLELELTLLGTRQQLYEMLELDRDLLPIAAASGESEFMLSYRWMR